MLHYYLQKGITPEQVLNQGYAARLFYYASMRKALEEEGRRVEDLV